MFDDHRSVQAKTQYAVDTGLHGTVFWTGDSVYSSVDGVDTPEARAMWSAALPDVKSHSVNGI